MSVIKGLLLGVFVIYPGMAVLGVLIGVALFGAPYGAWLLAMRVTSLGDTGDGIMLTAIIAGWLFLMYALLVEPGRPVEWLSRKRDERRGVIRTYEAGPLNPWWDASEGRFRTDRPNR